MMVAHMDCVDEPVSYFDYENITTQAMADSLDCGVRKLKLTTVVLLFPVEMSFFRKHYGARYYSS